MDWSWSTPGPGALRGQVAAIVGGTLGILAAFLTALGLSASASAGFVAPVACRAIRQHLDRGRRAQAPSPSSVAFEL